MHYNIGSMEAKIKGFTLVEVLVVISVIALLASVVLVAMNDTRMKSRDVKRKADLRVIRNALELYYDANGQYPQIAKWATSEATTYDNGTKWALLRSALAPYISALPGDPRPMGTAGPWTNGNYHYAYSSTSSSVYDLVAQLENHGDPETCQHKFTLYHSGEGTTPPNGSWCGNYSQYIYADH